MLEKFVEVAEGPVKSGEYMGPDNSLYVFSLEEPASGSSLMHRLIQDKDGPSRFFCVAAGSDKVREIEQAYAAQKSVHVIASPFSNKTGAHPALVLKTEL